MENKVGLCIDPNSFHLENKLLTGIIAFKIGDTFFPEKYWNDFVVVVLNWWVIEFLSFNKAHKTQLLELNFMDGPGTTRILCEFEKIRSIEMTYGGESIFFLFDDYCVGEFFYELRNAGLEFVETLEKMYPMSKIDSFDELKTNLKRNWDWLF